MTAMKFRYSSLKKNKYNNKAGEEADLRMNLPFLIPGKMNSCPAVLGRL